MLNRRVRHRLSRDEKARLTRESLLSAGCKVVAAEGYASASIAKIAETARVAHGTFYNYFVDRQALFDELLPYEGMRMLGTIEKAARKARPGVARELARFNAFLHYVAENNGFYRVLYEAEVFAPDAHRIHMANIVSGYRRSIKRGIAGGYIALLTDDRIDCIIYQLLGMRAYAAMQIHYEKDISRRAVIIENSLYIYERIIRTGLLMG
ncbi:TetR/AcrR family transcriptional regulator [Rhizobium rhizogenes]|uniref:TetR/AcrR family transcriptional regulator n=1 Tax=Rhizobium rhizogenes TaxID=359 RepID=UPI001574A220|nr:TetR/AcrR family transcriptional regulator [Rhizobium rhizogenes]NTH23363.1 TetR/AcrR family transcriptional regulator [Rhizobium rhizogenes]NTH36385.1 TetR/AcrR family transcriptional regulator [Rhizobium rhizogenes]